MKLFSNGVINYSKDQFWWHGDEIDYDEKDQFSGQLDRNNRPFLKMMLLQCEQLAGLSPNQIVFYILTLSEVLLSWRNWITNRYLNCLLETNPFFIKVS